MADIINEKSIGEVKNRYQIAVEAQRTKFDKFNDFDYIYHSKLKKSDPSIPSKVFNPIVWAFVETIITRMVAKTPTIAYKPREESDKIQANIFTDLFSYWFDKTNAFSTIVSWIKDALIYGTGVVKIDWYKSKPRKVKGYEYDATGEPVIGEDGNYIVNEQEIVDNDDVRIQNINIYDFFIDPNATSIKDANWVIYQYKTTVSELENYPIYSKSALKRIKQAKTSSKGTQLRDVYESRRKEAVGLNSNLLNDTSVDSILCWEMWTKDRLVVVADGQELLYDDEQPYWHGEKPFISIVDSIVPHEFWGKGEIEPVEKLLHALNTIQNQRIVNVNRILSPMWEATSRVDDSELQYEDNGIIHVQNLKSDVDVISIPNVTGTALQETNILIETIQRALGVTDLVQGLNTPGATAQEVALKTEQANARFAHKVKVFEETGLKTLGELFYKLCQQYMTANQVIRIVGSDGEKYQQVSPADLTGDFDVVPEADSTLASDNNADFQKYMNLFMVLQQYFGQQTPMGQTPGIINEQEAIKELLNKSGVKDPERFIERNVNETGAMGEQGVNGQEQNPLAGIGTPQVMPGNETPGIPQGLGNFGQ